MHLNKFTSIISLLAVQHPQCSNQLQILRTAIIKWHDGVEELMLEKNRMIMKAKTRGNQKLYILFKEIQQFFSTLLKNYSDPNLPLFFRAFKKIKEQFQFIDIDFSKYQKKYKEAEVQTDSQHYLMFGVDMQKFMKNYETKQDQLQKANQKIIQLQDDNIKLKNQIGRLIEQMKKDSDQYVHKLKQLMQNLQKAKEDQIRNMSTEKRSLKYRSNPQIALNESPKKKIIRNLLENAFDNSLVHQMKDNTSSFEEDINAGDPELWRFLYCQALGIEGILQNVAQYHQ